MANLKNSVIFFVLVFGFASCQSNSQNLLCYDCDPQNYGEQCSDPETNNVRTSICDVSPDPEAVNGTVICLSAYFINTETTNSSGVTTVYNRTGIHRGCNTWKSEVINFCDWFVEEQSYKNVTVKSCVACNSTRCNTVAFRADGSSGSESIFSVTASLFLNALVVFIINK